MKTMTLNLNAIPAGAGFPKYIKVIITDSISRVISNLKDKCPYCGVEECYADCDQT